jgi:hypothetical protein
MTAEGRVSSDRILYESDGDLVDEIVCSGVDIHVEVMSDDSIWMGVYRDGKRLSVNFHKTSKRGPIAYFVEEDGEPWEWKTEERHPREDEPPHYINVKESADD